MNEWPGCFGGAIGSGWHCIHQSKYINLCDRFGREQIWLGIRVLGERKKAGNLDKVPFYVELGRGECVGFTTQKEVCIQI